MKSLPKTVLLALLALALAAVFSASASAAACTSHAGSKKYELCINGSSLTEPTTVPVSARGTTSLVLNLNNWARELSITCSSLKADAVNFHADPAIALKLTAQPLFQGCGFTGANPIAKKCITNTTAEFHGVTGHFQSPESSLIEPTAGTSLWEWNVSKKGSESCPSSALGTWSTTGTYICALSEPGVEEVEHGLTCTSSNHGTFVINAFTPLSYTEIVSLSGTRQGSKFSVYESS
jgi:hypothetical protein